ncbi:DgyrCDS2429 [Dimorphilus gyrociliatus]|uniref:SH3 domain-binding glutamic acid-rich-like protein n=1 Tax=Dimorphilus gyrociliatus TaxID=2664684 RepID=A0A7I8VAA3_9ANNE|nr:DgyrCDS2429 [Dimorphilus gyrociliatus]
MTVKLYFSSVSGKTEIKKQQNFIRQTLSSAEIDFEEIDVSNPHCEDDKYFMLEHSKNGKESSPIPPQLFNDTQYCGDYEAFCEAVEKNSLNEFLHLDD